MGPNLFNFKLTQKFTFRPDPSKIGSGKIEDKTHWLVRFNFEQDLTVKTLYNHCGLLNCIQLTLEVNN